MPATNPDGTYTREFLLWEAQLAALATGREAVEAARRLRLVLGVPAEATAAFVHGISDITAETCPVVASLRKAHIDAQGAFTVAMMKLADLDPTVDIRALLPA